MNPIRRSLLVYGLLCTAWSLIVAWQVAEHVRVRKSARVALRNRAKDISTTLGVVIKSQRRFGGLAFQGPLESALKELVGQGELTAVALLNAAGEKVATAGPAIDLEPKDLIRTGEHWGDQRVIFANLVDLGVNVTREPGATNVTIVLPHRERPGSETNRPPPPPDFFPGSETNRPAPPEVFPNAEINHPPPRAGESANDTNRVGDEAFGPPRDRDRDRGWGRPRPPRDGRPGFGRPFWMSEEEYKALMEKQGVHSFVLVMSLQSMLALCSQDLWLRSIIVLLASVSVVGSGLAWRNLGKSAELQIRLVRTSELNAHLKEMNLAAAGLAHETRNPLNIIRGVAQLIARQNDTPPEIRQQSARIIDEADRVTAQLSEFINYSRPREVRRTALPLVPVVAEVVRALSCDWEEKRISLHPLEESFTVEADEQLLRQALFNLLLNAIQAAEPGGEIRVVAVRQGASELSLEVRDNGPGVPAEHRSEIFKPYFTTQKQGTGLGLAVVQQIVLAHGWEVACLPNEPRGAIFRISHIRLVA